MIDWLSVAANGAWILGLAIMLAGISYFYWVAAQSGESFGYQLGKPNFLRVEFIGLLLVGLGLILTGEGTAQLIIGGVLVALCLLALLSLGRRVA